MIEKIDQDLLEAQKNKEETKRDILRLIKSALKNAEIEKGSELNDDEVTAVLSKEVKKRKESISAYEQASRPELAASEKAEMDVIQVYLPSMMSEDDVTAAIDAYLAASPTTIDKMGQAMGALSAELKGKADMGQVSQILRSRLQ